MVEQVGFLGYFLLIIGCFQSIFSYDLDRSVVSVCTRSYASGQEPWQRSSLLKYRGTGFVVSSSHVVTNAHVVRGAVDISVHIDGSSHRSSVKNIVFGEDCDLALLEIEDPLFAALSEPLTLGEEPDLGTTVDVIGYPGILPNPVLTRGVVSSFQGRGLRYSLPVVQIDAPINAGNSGGPVLHGDQVVGVVCGKHGGFSVDNVAFMIPVSVLKNFLEEAKQGSYLGLPAAPFSVVPLQNTSLRASLCLDHKTRGVLVISSSVPSLKEGDILTHIDHLPIDNEGFVLHNRIRRSLFAYMVLSKHVGDPVLFDILQEGRKKQCEVQMIPRGREGGGYATQQSYYVYSGCVFSTKIRADQEMVYLLKVLPHPVNIGYHSYRDLLVEEIDHKPLQSMEELIAYLQEEREYQVLTLEGGAWLVFDEKSREKQQEILAQFHLKSDQITL
ncbi:MAG: trypsin-like peptidase domain-containing protein [Chlamydiota bacterium]